MAMIVSALFPSANLQSSRALWYLTRSTGLVALVLLTATVVVGVVASVGWTGERWPRFLSQNIHRNLSLFCLGFVALHVITTVSDGYVPIGFADAIVPFRTAYRPLWVGLGALTFDLLIAVLVTSALRHRIGFGAWRFVHWLAYLCWPIALVHGLGSGSDAARSVVLTIDLLCSAAVATVIVWRLVTGRTFTTVQRGVAAGLTFGAAGAIALFAALGPLRPGWSLRAGTSPALLTELAKKARGSASTAPSAGPSTSAPSNTSGPGGVPAAPFSVGVTGTQSTARAGSDQVRVVLSMQLQGSATPLTVTLTGFALQGGGVAMSSGTVALGSYSGQVTGLEGGTIDATVGTPTPLQLVIVLSVDQTTGALTGTVTGSIATGSR